MKLDTPVTDSAIGLLVISGSLSDTDRFVTALRNAGLPVHATRVEEEEELSELLSEQVFDMIIWAGNEDSVDIERAIRVYNDSGKDIPLIVVSDLLSTEATVQAMRDGAKDCIGMEHLEHLQLASMREIAALRTRRELAAAKKLVGEAEQRCSALIGSSRDAIAYVHEGMHIQANPTYLEMFGFVDSDDIEGLPIMDMIVPEGHKEFKAFLRSLRDQGPTDSQLDVECQKNDGTTFDAKLEFSKASIDGEPCTQVIIRKQDQEKELEQKIHTLYSKDDQTGLYNRQYFLEQLEQRLLALDRENDRLALLFVTLDDIQQLRDAVGLATTDTVLKEVAELFEQNIESGDLLARYGDHSFSLVTDRSKILGEQGLAEELCTLVDAHNFTSSGKFLSASCSIGVAYSDTEIRSAQDFVNRAYTACETARQDGGNQPALYRTATLAADEDRGATSSDHLDIAKLIRNALENDSFHLVYQPIVSLQGDTRENYAVLLRLVDQEDEEVLPRDFLDQPLPDGLAARIDRWVIRNAIRELAVQRQEGHRTVFFINICRESLQDETLLLWICDCLRDAGVKGAWICFQIKDEDIRRDIQKAGTLLAGLKKIRCQLAVDHFGGLPKPEGLLKLLKFDYAKLDSSYMKELATSQEQQDRLNTIADLVHSYDAKSIATAVEDANSLAILWTVGIKYIQGYFLQEPSASIEYDFQGGGR